jgi:hypothetical protein
VGQAWLAARAVNAELARRGLSPCVRYSLSGGDPAIVLSIELPEDDPNTGAVLLLRLASPRRSLLSSGREELLKAAGSASHVLVRPACCTRHCP